MKILLIEDEQLLAQSIQTLLTVHGFQVEVVYDGDAGAEYAQLGIYDLLILDVMIPGLNGLQVARQVRANRCNVPILMLSAKSDISDRIEGLNAGADYYLTKPFASQELLACINALLRRQGGQVDVLSYGDTELDLETSLLRHGDRSVRLSAREFDVMRMLLQGGEKITSKEVLLARVWGYESNAGDNHVEVYIAFLRRKLQSIGADITIETQRRMGYYLEKLRHD